MRIVPSYNLGALGPAEGPATLYDWRWHYSVPSLSLWIVLAIAMVLPKANRRPGVLLIVAPAVILYGGLLAILKWVVPSSASQDDSINTFILSIAAGSALLWLLGYTPAGRAWWRTLVGALAIMAGVAVLTALAFRFEVSAYNLSMMGGLGIPLLAIVAGYAIAARKCRKSYRFLRFAFWLAIGTTLFSIAGAVVFILVQCTRAGLPLGLMILGSAALGGLILGAIAFLISLPFLLVGLRTSMFRRRLWSCLRLESGPVAPEDTAGAQGRAAIGASDPLPTR